MMKIVRTALAAVCQKSFCGVLACGLLLPLSAQTNLISNVNAPIGVATAPNEILVTATTGAWPPAAGNPVVIYSIDPTSGNQTLFATMPAPVGNATGFIEDYLAISPGVGCFPAGNVYVTQGNQIYVIPPTGGTPVLFATLTGPPPSFNGAGITFDTTGLFGFKLIVTTANGLVYTVDCHGGVTQIASISGAWLEQPQVAPASFGNFGGDLFVADEKSGLLYVIGPTGAVLTTLQTNLFEPEAVRFIPAAGSSCTVGTTGDELLATIFDHNQLVGMTPTALSSVANTMVVFGEFGGSAVITPTTSGLQIAAGPLSLSQVEDVAVASCVQRVGTGRMTGGGSVFTSNNTRVTHGFELHCNASTTPNNLEINWAGGNNFHLENLTSAFCFMDPRFTPNPPAAPFNTYIGTGTGLLNNVPGATARWTFTDAGEPGTKDRAQIVIIDAGGNIVLTVDGLLHNGNQQAHNQ